MRSLLLCLLLAVGVSASPLTFPPMDSKAHGFTISVGGDWGPGPVPSMAHKLEEKYAPNYPESISGFAQHERDAGTLVERMLMVQKMQGKKEFEEVKLGKLRALLKREKTGFTIHSGEGSTQITITYTDGRDSLDRTPYDAILSEILNSFELTR